MTGRPSASAITTGTGPAIGVATGWKVDGAVCGCWRGGAWTTDDWSDMSSAMFALKLVRRLEMLDWTVSSAFSNASNEKTSDPNRPEVSLS
jgi:hypothetical protein